MQIKSFPIVAALLIVFAISNLTNAQISFPAGFNQVLVAPGIIGATTMANAPDGRFFIAQQNGLLLVVKNNTLLSKPFISLNVNTNGERGLLGVAFDPAFTTNQYIYLCYTIANGNFNRVSRFTASGDTVVPGSEVIIIELDSLIANYHGGGHLQFGPDGKLYIAAGENGRPFMSQDLDSYLGKILRINSDGSVPFNNPFPGPGKRQRVWAYGLRNPFTFTFQQGTGRFFLNDVGDTTYEEINEATLGGRNFGWPNAEGNNSDTNYVNPFYTYHHGNGPGLGCAITGGTFFNPGTTNYPSQYINKYFFIDYCGNWIDMITLTNPPVWSTFASSIANYSVGIMTGLDGNLYYVSRNDEALYKISYTPNPFPIIVNQPQSQTISVGYGVTFSVTASGTLPILYQWRKDTVPINNATGNSYTIPAVAFSDSGNYNVVATNSFGSTTSNNAHLTVTPNQPPHAVIDTPMTNTFYTAGDVVHFHGTATDPEDGILPDSIFEWVVIFHHYAHIHPGPTAGNGFSSGSFTIPNNGETSTNVFYRLYLIVHDHEGAVDSAYVDLYPRTSTLTINTQPSGLTITLDGQPFTTPNTVLSVEGMIRTIGAPYSQMIGQTAVMFTAWNNGGTLTQSFSTPVNDTALTAYYDSLQLQYNLGTDKIICIGDTIILDAGANYTSYAWTVGSVNQFLSLQSAVADTITVGVTVTDSTGAAGNDSINIIFDICNSTGAIQNEFINIFPVPSGGEITISELPENYFLNVIDMTGRVIISNDFVTAYRPRNIHLLPGIYSFLLLATDNHVLCHKDVAVIR